jgi:hypothetical protein
MTSTTGTTSNTSTTGRAGELRHNILSVVDAFAQSVALLSLALGVAFASSAAAGYTGPTVPLAYLIAGIGSLCLASVIIRFTRHMASAGGLYTYIAARAARGHLVPRYSRVHAAAAAAGRRRRRGDHADGDRHPREGR